MEEHGGKYINESLVGGWATHLKNVSQFNLDHFPKFRGEHKKYLSSHHLHPLKTNEFVLKKKRDCFNRSWNIFQTSNFSVDMLVFWGRYTNLLKLIDWIYPLIQDAGSSPPGWHYIWQGIPSGKLTWQWEKPPFLIGDTSSNDSNGRFPIAMLVFRGPLLSW